MTASIIRRGDPEAIAMGSPRRRSRAIVSPTPGIGAPVAVTSAATRSTIRSSTSASLSRRAPSLGAGSRSRQTGTTASMVWPVEPSSSSSVSSTPSVVKTATSTTRHTGSVSMSRPSMSRTTASIGGRLTR